MVVGVGVVGSRCGGGLGGRDSREWWGSRWWWGPGDGVGVNVFWGLGVIGWGF